MSNVYLEELIKRKKTAGSTVLNIVMIAVTVLAGILSVLTFNIMAFLPFVALCVACALIIPRASVEWEYQYIDGELDIDRIINKAKRKRMASFQITDAEMVAPLTSHQMDYYNSNDKLKIMDFTSGEAEREKNIYAMIVPVKGAVTKVLFEPSEKMVKDMRLKAPRKVFFD